MVKLDQNDLQSDLINSTFPSISKPALLLAMEINRYLSQNEIINYEDSDLVTVHSVSHTDWLYCEAEEVTSEFTQKYPLLRKFNTPI